MISPVDLFVYLVLGGCGVAVAVIVVACAVYTIDVVFGEKK